MAKADTLPADADFLERTCASTMRQVILCIGVLLITLSVSLDYYVSWSGNLASRDEAALTILNQIYPEEADKPPAKGPTVSAEVVAQRANAFAGSVEKQLKAETTQVEKQLDPAARREQPKTRDRADYWRQGADYLAGASMPPYLLNTPEQRNAARTSLRDSIKNNQDEFVASERVQLPLIGISFDIRNSGYVMGGAMVVALMGLVFALRRELWVTKSILEKNAHADSDTIGELALRQLIYLPQSALEAKERLPSKVRVNSLRALVAVAGLVQLQFVASFLKEQPHLDAMGPKILVPLALFGLLILGAGIFLAWYTQSLLTQIWMAWNAALDPKKVPVPVQPVQQGQLGGHRADLADQRAVARVEFDQPAKEVPADLAEIHDLREHVD